MKKVKIITKIENINAVCKRRLRTSAGVQGESYRKKKNVKRETSAAKRIKALGRLRSILLLILIALVAFVGITAVDAVTCGQVHGDGIICRKIGFITKEERYRDEDGGLKSEHQFTDVRNGDIFISMSTHTLGWRHGHAAVVIDAERGITLEAALWGKPSEKMRMWHWSSYANAVHLRVSEEAAASALAASGIARDTSIAASAQLGCLAAAFAEEYENGVMYGLFSGIPDKAPAPSAFEKTQCAHLVWYAYKQFGLDLDADGSWLVTPRDIAKSDKLVVIEAFGDYEY